jgi:hypothetical protein
LVTILTLAIAAASDAPYEEPPISYNTATPANAITALQQRIDKGEATLAPSDQHGYLDALLRELKIPVSSQALVFSKTSFQRERISPKHPRALYFNDDVYVGCVPGGDILEIAAADPRLGVNFYTLDQSQEGSRPKIVRQTDSCLQCHAGSMTRDVPGLMVRSVFTDRRGQPILSAGTFLTTDESPMKERWGGWYVTGTHGAQRHMGNVTCPDEDHPDALDRDAGANVTDLSAKFDATRYLSAQSDLAALSVLAHQVELHNRFVRASYGVRLALRDVEVMNKALGRPKDFRSDSTVSRIRSVCEPLVKGMLFCGTAEWSEPVHGSSTFAADYAARGPRDSQGRSLRDLDLQRRLLKYPCSPLIYSETFDGLPDAAREYVYHRLFEVLTGKDTSKDFAHLSPADRRAVLEILRETKPNLPNEWR